jgi:hypothetical protein
MGEILVSPDENNRVEHAGFFRPAADEPGAAGNNAKAFGLINLQKFAGLASLNLASAVLVDHR